jgi:hypothetical protein
MMYCRLDRCKWNSVELRSQQLSRKVDCRLSQNIAHYLRYKLDITGPIEDAVAKADDTYNCNAYLCRGYQYEDNTDNVKVVQAGDLLVFHVNLVAGHHPGWAVSE